MSTYTILVHYYGVVVVVVEEDVLEVKGVLGFTDGLHLD